MPRAGAAGVDLTATRGAAEAKHSHARLALGPLGTEVPAAAYRARLLSAGGDAHVTDTGRRAVPSSLNALVLRAKVIELEGTLWLILPMTAVMLRERLMAGLTDFGRHLGYDGKTYSGCSRPSRREPPLWGTTATHLQQV